MSIIFNKICFFLTSKAFLNFMFKAVLMAVLVCVHAVIVVGISVIFGMQPEHINDYLGLVVFSVLLVYYFKNASSLTRWLFDKKYNFFEGTLFKKKRGAL